MRSGASVLGAERLNEALAQLVRIKILIFLRDHIGDVVNSTGAVARIIERFPNADVTVVVGNASAEIIRRISGVAHVWLRRKHLGLLGKGAFVRRVRVGKFDLGIILDDSNEMIVHMFLGKVPIRVGVRKSKHFGLFTSSVGFDPDGHDLFPSLEGVLGLLGASIDVTPKLEIREAERESARGIITKLFGTQTGPIVAIHPGASVVEKQWPVENFSEVARLLAEGGFECLVLFGPGEEAIADRVACQSKIPRPLSIFEYGAVLEQVGCLITNDTGPAHIAAAVGTPVIVLYGPTSPQRFHPFGDLAVPLYKSKGCDFYSGRCLGRDAGLKACDHRCFEGITVAEVVQAAQSALGC